MSKCKVIIEDSAQADVQDSYDWGCRMWGKTQAQKWVRDLRTAITKRLATIPTAFPRAPENDEFEDEIRQMIVGPYRVLFTIRGKRVHVLHVRGAYVGSIGAETADE
jgi:plasmid stabilization system protein ParE